jgi:hypothetical protein
MQTERMDATTADVMLRNMLLLNTDIISGLSLFLSPFHKKKKLHGLSPRANYTDRAEVIANVCG